MDNVDLETVRLLIASTPTPDLITCFLALETSIARNTDGLFRSTRNVDAMKAAVAAIAAELDLRSC